MKKSVIVKISIIVLVLIGILVFWFTTNNNDILKPEYSVGEKAKLDDIEITLKDVNYINKNTGIELSFEITNKMENTITITPDDYFKFYEVNKVQIPNIYKNDKNIVKKEETITYKLQYNTNQRELYEIYFYSQIAENNIKFSFTAKDISTDEVKDTSEDRS